MGDAVINALATSTISFTLTTLDPCSNFTNSTSFSRFRCQLTKVKGWHATLAGIGGILLIVIIGMAIVKCMICSKKNKKRVQNGAQRSNSGVQHGVLGKTDNRSRSKPSKLEGRDKMEGQGHVKESRVRGLSRKLSVRLKGLRHKGRVKQANAPVNQPDKNKVPYPEPAALGYADKKDPKTSVYQDPKTGTFHHKTKSDAHHSNPGHYSQPGHHGHSRQPGHAGHSGQSGHGGRSSHTGRHKSHSTY